MRSRFSALARKEANYLFRTLHPDHPDRAYEKASMVADMKAMAREVRYASLSVLDTRPPNDEGIAQVLFFARIFNGSTDVSFVELSDFAHDGEGWRYLRGILAPGRPLKVDPLTLRIPTFLEIGSVKAGAP